MPLVVKDFKWKQSENTITIQVPLHGVHQSKVDLFTSRKYIKATFGQFFFEVLFLNDVIPKQSKCTLTYDKMVLELVKAAPKAWECLEEELPRAERNALKMELINEEYERTRKEDKAKLEKKAELKRVAVQQAIDVDTRYRNNIDTIRRAETVDALGDVENWRRQIEPRIVEITDDEIKKPPPPKRNSKPISTVPPAVLPELRKFASLAVAFTERALPTPSRESRLQEENEWLEKQAAARRTVGFVQEDLRAEEKNPQHLLSKGNQFLAMGNYLGAISAYSFGIKLSEQFAELHVKRSEAHYKQGNFCKAIQDCSRALELMVPAVPANLKDRTNCIGRRGMALCNIGMAKNGVKELEAAIALNPDDKEFTSFMAEVKKSDPETD